MHFIFASANLFESEEVIKYMLESIIRYQANVAFWGITVICALAILVAAATWFTNFEYFKLRLNIAIKKVYTDLELKKNEMDNLVNIIKSEADKRMTKIEGTQARVFAIVNEQIAKSITVDKMRWYASEIYWLAEGIIKFSQLNYESDVKEFVGILNKRLDYDTLMFDERHIKKIKECLNYFPKLLLEEKKQIIEKLKKYEKKE